ncbi:MAG: hypothetical protein HYW90_01010 [Candidatus Sungbacteria bacterium]|nr:hypothetical protein [Candidatus Sungbacteria bacterium]
MNPYLLRLSAYSNYPRFYAWPHFDKMREFAEKIALQELVAPSWRDGIYPEDDLEFVQFLGMVDTINFYFTDAVTKTKFQTLWPECRACGQDLRHYEKVDEKKRVYRCLIHEQPARLHSGATAMTACLRRALKEGLPITDPKFLRDLREWNLKRAANVFRGVPPLNVIPMLRERRSLLYESALRLQDFDDQWINVFRGSSFRAFDNGRGVVEVIASFESFYDVYTSLPLPGGGFGPPLPFFKRAHLFAQMYEGRARSSSVLTRLKGTEFLILPADYELPKALSSPEIGALKFSPELQQKIRNQEVLEDGSAMVVETRLATVELGEVFQESVNQIRKAAGLDPYTKVEEDYPLWLAGRNSPDPHIIVPSTRF